MGPGTRTGTAGPEPRGRSAQVRPGRTLEGEDLGTDEVGTAGGTARPVTDPVTDEVRVLQRGVDGLRQPQVGEPDLREPIKHPPRRPGALLRRELARMARL